MTTHLRPTGTAVLSALGLGLVVGTALASSVILSALPHLSSPVPGTITLDLSSLPACEYEDSADCAWDASTSGNSVGHSFIDVNGTAYYDVRVPR